MRKYLLTLVVSLLVAGHVYAQVPKAKIVTEPMSARRLTNLGITTNSVSSGLKIAPNGTYFYFTPKNIANSDPVTAFTFTLLSKPNGSNAVLENLPSNITGLKADVVGAYQVKLDITTSGGVDDTTFTFYAANFVGVGNFDGVAGTFPKCMACHSSMPAFQTIFNAWKDDSHGMALKTQMTSGPASFGVNCLKCHTTGYDKLVTANNGGFDDIALQLGYVYAGPPNAAKWDSLKTGYPGLVNVANVGCEMCHGAGSQHASAPSSANIQINSNSNACMECHDAPTHHNQPAQFENTLHNTPVWSSSFAQGTSSQNNNLQNCIRCHDGQGYINYSKNETTNTTGWTFANQTHIGCSTCHDPHGNANPHNLRFTPVSGDTLATGEAYTVGGTAKTCMSCHKSRRDNVTYMTSTLSAYWGPHHSTQTDNLLGKNAAEFGTAYISSNGHKNLANACASCHMAQDTTAANKYKVGGHSWKMHNPETNYDFTEACKSCHGPINSFEDIMASGDHDGDGTVEPFQSEFDGLAALLRYYLPPVGLDSISWQMIATNNNLIEKKAYWNYQLIVYDASRGVHNPKYAVSVLSKSIQALGGIIPVELVEFKANVTNNVVTLNWQTGSETNNKGFSVERKVNGNWTAIGFINGKGTTTEVSNYSFIDKDAAKQSTKKLSYRIKQIDLDGKFQYSKEIEVEIVMPGSLSLGQNYPNPFNPSTKITFEVPATGYVTLKVYNISGTEVATLVSKPMDAGKHEVTFDASGLASGVYLYSIQQGTQTITKKMVLMK